MALPSTHSRVKILQAKVFSGEILSATMFSGKISLATISRNLLCGKIGF
jgi:hypothetical protein